MVQSVFVELDIIKLRVYVEHVILTPTIMEEIVFVIMVTLVMLINVKNVIKVVESALVKVQKIVSHVPMLVMILLMDIVKERLLVQLDFILMENNVNLVHLIVLTVNQKIYVTSALTDLIYKNYNYMEQ